MSPGPAHAARVEPSSPAARGAAPEETGKQAASEAGPLGLPVYAMGAGASTGAAAGTGVASPAANSPTMSGATASLGGLPMYAAAPPLPAAEPTARGRVIALSVADTAAASAEPVGEAAADEGLDTETHDAGVHDSAAPHQRLRKKRHDVLGKRGHPQAATDKKTTDPKAKPALPATAGHAADHTAAGAKPALPGAAGSGVAGAASAAVTAKPASPASAGAGASAVGVAMSGAGGGGGGGVATEAGEAGAGAGGAESPGTESGEAAQETSQEKVHDRMADAEQPAQGAASEASGEASAGGGEASADAGTDAGDAAGETAGGTDEVETISEPSSQAGAIAATLPESSETERDHARSETQEEHEQSREAAEDQSDERANDQSERQAEIGEATPSGGAEIGSGERDAGLASLGESVGGGGGGGGDAAAAGGGGGGGGGTPIPEPEPAPDTASGDPASGLASASSLQPMQAAKALDGVGTSIDTTVQDEGTALQSQMPEVEVGGDGSGSAVVAADSDAAAPAVKRAEAGPAQPTPEPEPLPEPGPSPTAFLPIPFVSDGQDGKVNRDEASEVQGSVASMPTTDPDLDTSAGAPPPLAKTGDADPAQMQEQRGHLDATIADQRAKGAADAARPAGERDVRDRTARERLQAPKIAAGGAGGAAGVAVPDDESLGIVAESQKGGEVRAAMAQAQGDMAGKRVEHDRSVGEEKEKTDADLARLKAENRADRQAEKQKVQSEVGQARADWSAEQNAQVAKTNNKAQAEIAKGNKDIATEETKGNAEATTALAAGEAEAVTEKQKAEREAAAKKREAEKQEAEDSDGIFGWIASKVSSFFNALKNAITAVFDLAKRAVKWAIDKAKKAAMWAIEKARSAIVGLIRAVGAALIVLGDVLLAAFPSLKKKWRSFIEGKVKAAEDAVNRLADALKKGVTKLLDALGKAFEFLLDAYKKAMLMVLDAAKGVVMGAINAAKAIAQLLGTFVVLIKDIARSPGEWLSKLGAAAVDGIKNHLWGAFKTAVKEWFNGKLEETLGIGLTIWNVLKKGGVTIKEVGQMAFDALKEAIPPALIQLLVEKLVAMIVPAAGAVMAIIEGLQAAWGTVQKIIAAIGKFVAFLKAVKSGGAGPSFAEMLASAAIVVIDFVANWLLKKLRKPAGKVAGKVKAIAQKIMAKVKGAFKKIGGALKKAGGWVKGKFKTGKKKVGDWWAKKTAKHQAKKQAKHDAKHAGKDGKPDHTKKQQDKEAAKRKKWEIAERETRAAIAAMLANGTGGIAFRAKVFALKLRWGWKALQIKPSGATSFSVQGRINPTMELGSGEIAASLTAQGIETQTAPQREEPQWEDRRADTSAGGQYPMTRDQHAAAMQPAAYERQGGQSGKGANPWELATNRYVTGPLAEDVAASHDKTLGMAFKPTADPEQNSAARRLQENARRKSSTEGRIDVKPQSMYRESFGGGFFKRTPDFEMLVKMRQGRRVEVSEVNLVEQTVDVMLTRSKSSRKRIQIPATIAMAAKRYPGAQIVYHIIAPVGVHHDTREAIIEDIRNAGLGARVKVVWHAIKPPE